MFGVGGLMRTLEVPEHLNQLYHGASRVTFAAGIVVLGLGLLDLSVVKLMAALTVLVLVPVFYGIRVWINVFGARDIMLE